MKRTLKRIPVGQDQTRFISTITGDELFPEYGDAGRRILQHALLQALVDQPDLLLCGSEPFHKMNMRWLADRWVIELEATVSI